MKKFQLIFLVSIPLLLPNLFYSQSFTPDYLKPNSDIIPVTPNNASNFMEYGNTPVDLATGIPQISLPLYSLTKDGVTIPISLSYHASGIKVSDLSGPVGLKWSLNVGGGIYRQVNDKIDEEGWLTSNRGYVDNIF